MRAARITPHHATAPHKASIPRHQLPLPLPFPPPPSVPIAPTQCPPTPTPNNPPHPQYLAITKKNMAKYITMEQLKQFYKEMDTKKASLAAQAFDKAVKAALVRDTTIASRWAGQPGKHRQVGLGQGSCPLATPPTFSPLPRRATHAVASPLRHGRLHLRAICARCIPGVWLR